jgi:XTP/dITP diphosphohydrolase
MRLLIGTTNPGKIADYKKFLRHANLELITPQDIGFAGEPLEIGETFQENAIQKARFYAERTEYPTLSDDGGFEVDALDGRPGVDSNRWLGPNASDQDKIDKIIELTRGVPESQRTCRLVAITVVYFPDVKDYVLSSNSIEGTVPEVPDKNIVPKLPYRSVLYLPEFKRCYSELSQSELQQVDHRKQICRELLLKLEPYLNF